MSVYIDSREDIPISGAIRMENLEAWSGADIMISRLSIPCKTRSLFERHIDSGAILAQLKIGEDLASSVGDRLNDSLARMRSVTKRTASHWLLFIGTIGCDKEGSAQINGHRTHRSVSFATLDGAIVGWIARGGVFYSLPRIEMLDAWVHAMERRLGEYEAQQYKYAFSQQDMPDDLDEALQIPVRVTDSRRVAIGFRNLGPELVNRSWEYVGHDFKTWLNFMTDETNAGKVEGIGIKTIKSIRRQCGLQEDDGPMLWDTSTVADNTLALQTIIRGIGKTVRDFVENENTIDEFTTKAEREVIEKRKAATIAKDTSDLFGNQKARAK